LVRHVVIKATDILILLEYYSSENSPQEREGVFVNVDREVDGEI
jgi:hypothetical protein